MLVLILILALLAAAGWPGPFGPNPNAKLALIACLLAALVTASVKFLNEEMKFKNHQYHPEFVRVEC